MRFRAGLGGGLALLLGASFLGAAAGPYGSGFAGLGYGYENGGLVQRSEVVDRQYTYYPSFSEVDTPGTTESDVSASGTWRVYGSLPLSSVCGLNLALRQTTNSLSEAWTWRSNNPGYVPPHTHFTAFTQMTAGRISFEIFPGAIAGLPFHPGQGANPSGWLYWPSIETGAFASQNYASQLGGYIGSDTGGEGQDVALSLPLATWLTVCGSYSGQFNADSTNLSVYGPGLLLKGYISLWPGAAADPKAAFFPKLGRVGQLEAELGRQWGYCAPGDVQILAIQTTTASLAAPLGAHFALRLSASTVQAGQPLFLTARDGAVTYDFSVDFALGRAARRESSHIAWPVPPVER